MSKPIDPEDPEDDELAVEVYVDELPPLFCPSSDWFCCFGDADEEVPLLSAVTEDPDEIIVVDVLLLHSPFTAVMEDKVPVVAPPPPPPTEQETAAETAVAFAEPLLPGINNADV